MLDNGYPLTTEPNALKAMIAPPTTAGRIAAMVSVSSNLVLHLLHRVGKITGFRYLTRW